ncbi:MAG TPA: hypothetical protein VMB51_04135 [Solirubrobacteraceae bacterium]|nr:hypothetical protein [Solirubrobacteraceae bacterium]
MSLRCDDTLLAQERSNDTKLPGPRERPALRRDAQKLSITAPSKRSTSTPSLAIHRPNRPSIITCIRTVLGVYPRATSHAR